VKTSGVTGAYKPRNKPLGYMVSFQNETVQLREKSQLNECRGVFPALFTIEPSRRELKEKRLA
jgi:hypothetical protein